MSNPPSKTLGNNLERNVAVIFSAIEPSPSDRGIAGVLNEYEATPVFVSLNEAAKLDTSMFDGIVLNEISTADTKLASTFDKLLRKFHRESKPIGSIGRSVVLIVSVFGATNVEVTAGHDEAAAPELVAALKKTGALYTPCLSSDYISDRDHKVLTTPGSLLDGSNGISPNTVAGIRKLLRELVEMA